MNIPKGYDQAQAYDGSFERLAPGGYICRILNAWVETTQGGSEQIALALDIAEGPQQGFYNRQFRSKQASDPNAKWPCVFRQFTLGSDGMCNPYFKGMLKSIEESNPGYAWNWNEATLQNRMIGMIFREEEFEASDKSIKTTVRPAFPRSTQRIREGVDVPEIRRLNKNKGGAQGGSFDSFQGSQKGSNDFTPYDGKLPWEQ